MPRLNDLTDLTLTGIRGSLPQWAPVRITGFSGTGVSNPRYTVFRVAASSVIHKSTYDSNDMVTKTYLVGLDLITHHMTIGEIYNNTSSLKGDLYYTHRNNDNTTPVGWYGKPVASYNTTTGYSTLLVPVKPSDGTRSYYLRHNSGDGDTITQVFLPDGYYPTGFYNAQANGPQGDDNNTAELLVPGENGVWIAAVFKEGGDGSAHIAYSSDDGATWTISSTTIPYATNGNTRSTYLLSGDYAQGKFAILVTDQYNGTSTVYVMVSTNSTGSSYTSTTPFAQSNFQPVSLKFNAGMWVVTGSRTAYSDQFQYSTNLTNWYEYNIGWNVFTGSIPHDVLYSNDTQMLIKSSSRDTYLSIIGSIYTTLMSTAGLTMDVNNVPQLWYAQEAVEGSNTRVGAWYYTDDAMSSKRTSDSITILRNYKLAEWPPYKTGAVGDFKASTWELQGRLIYNYVYGRSGYQPQANIEKHPYTNTLYAITAWYQSGFYTAEIRTSTDGVVWNVSTTNGPVQNSTQSTLGLRVKGNNTTAAILVTDSNGDIYVSSTGDLSSLTKATITDGYAGSNRVSSAYGVFDNRQIVGVGNTWVVSGKSSSNSSNNVILVSTDGGATFGVVTGLSGLGTGQHLIIKYSGGKFISYCASASHKLHYSDDGVTWTYNSGLSVNQSTTDIFYANSKWHLYAEDWPQTFYIVPDITGSGSTYVQIWSPIRCKRLAYDNGKFVAVTEPDTNGLSKVFHFTDAQGGFAGTVPNYTSAYGNNISIVMDRYEKGIDYSTVGYYAFAPVYVNSTNKWIIPTDLGLIWAAPDSKV